MIVISFFKSFYFLNLILNSIKNNNGKIKIKDDPSNANVLTGIRERFYTNNEIKEWIKNGKIKQFRRE